ncbi:MAG TPA: DUF3857 domain-containing protein [Aliidongia sp.]|uniref:DUF3857 domain-containing protein n=1 Tax=Aliidongia sp. TaxID=1914230 RepID=UPI002DDD337C|nr:DUF3857 domain-containing protein [Aliidongia sp.]HEV2676326.1 DUF3857 domain-containing protein [Aliidongia sp.]
MVGHSRLRPALACSTAVLLTAAGCAPGTPNGQAPVSPSDLTTLATYGPHRAEAELAFRLMSGKGVARSPATGAALIRQLADTGDAGAETTLAALYLSGNGVEKSPTTAIEWYEKAAAQNYAEAEANLAFAYGRGSLVPADPARAFALAQKAATQGNAEGEIALGTAFAEGWGTAKDDQAALRWYRKAADHHHTRAQQAIGQAYLDGKGVAVNRILAFAWFSVAATNAMAFTPADSALASRARDDLALLLLPAEVQQGTQIAASWKPGVDLDAVAIAAGPTTAPPRQFNSPTTGTLQAAAGPRVDPPVVERLMNYDIDVQPSGNWTATMRREVMVRNEAAVKGASQVPLYFNSALDTVDVIEAYTLKSDGRKLPVDSAAIYSQLVPGSPTAPMFDDQKQKIVVFPDVEAGDVLVLSVKYTMTSLLPGLFSFHWMFDQTYAENDARVTIRAPQSMPLVTETHDVKFAQRSEGDKTVYEWRYANPSPLSENILALDPIDRAPRLFASSFKTYDQMASAYDALAEPKVTVTPRVQQLADSVTAGAQDRRKQAELLYDWVSRHIRYVGVELGMGAIVPHDVETILSNGYGDCKDHSTLFSTLLKAKGIPSQIVMINLGASYTLATPPTFGALNHAITYLPEFDLYADTTAGVAPFGVLPFPEYGKPVVFATATAPAIHHTPALSDGLATVTTRTMAKLGPDGKLSGESETTGTGPFAIQLRQLAVNIQSIGAEQAAKYQLRGQGFDGKGRFDFASPFAMADTFRIAGHFETEPHMELVSGNSFKLPLGLGLGAQPGAELLGPLYNFRDARGIEPTACFSGREVSDVSLELPPGKHPRELPKPADIKTDFMTYSSHWSLAGHTVTVHREFTSKVAQPICLGAVRLAAAKALNDIRGDYNKAMALTGG